MSKDKALYSIEKYVPSFKFATNEGLDPEIFLPMQAVDSNDTGYDVSCSKEMIIKPFEKVMIPLGIRAFSPVGWWLQLNPRSSSFAKKHLNCLYGVIDEGYENEIFLCAQYVPPPTWEYVGNSLLHYRGTKDQKELTIKFGERIGQLIPVQRKTMNVEHVSDKEFDELALQRKGARGKGGFGSSGDIA